MNYTLYYLCMLILFCSCSPENAEEIKLGSQDAASTIAMTEQIGKLRHAATSLASANLHADKMYWDSIYHSNNAMFWHHHSNFNHNNHHPHSDHNHTRIPYDHNVNHAHHYHHPHAGHQNDSLIVIPNLHHPNHHHAHSDIHGLNHHHVIDSLHHLHQQFHH